MRLTTTDILENIAIRSEAVGYPNAVEEAVADHPDREREIVEAMIELAVLGIAPEIPFTPEEEERYDAHSKQLLKQFLEGMKK